jgi:hypothetical protein
MQVAANTKDNVTVTAHLEPLLGLIGMISHVITHAGMTSSIHFVERIDKAQLL